jgi:hypothetical protein
MRAWITVAIRRHENSLEINADGWCLAAEAVKSVQFTLCGVSRRLPIYLPRPDVHAAINADNAYPPLHALCSGINGQIMLPGLAADDNPIAVDVDILAVDGRVVPRGRFMITPGADAILVN